MFVLFSVLRKDRFKNSKNNEIKISIKLNKKKMNKLLTTRLNPVSRWRGRCPVDRGLSWNIGREDRYRYLRLNE